MLQKGCRCLIGALGTRVRVHTRGAKQIVEQTGINYLKGEPVVLLHHKRDEFVDWLSKQYEMMTKAEAIQEMEMRTVMHDTSP